uniref:Uncharacterized protein n=1 Tax=Alexandrium catenella TaxID=2925 RepID=A0A7S1LNR3_ALECA|mmetsp:Transcript_117171/g.311647  ORF Transcript_117171/g.311647 Transcript_117171/m.311647 type:complete len:398 (+) Transcript_117171:3-1196(+)
MALHLEHRLVVPAGAAPALAADGAPAGEEGASQGAAEGEAPAEGAAEPSGPPASASLPETLLSQLGQAITDDAGVTALEALEAAAAAKAGAASEPAKKRAKGASMPVDVDMVLQVHERLLEALNATHFLAILRSSAAASRAGIVTPVLAREVELRLWRWASAADTMRPLADGPRLPATWVTLGRVLQQMAHSDIPTLHVIEALVRQLCRVTDEVPADDAQLKKPLQAIFQRLEFEPQLVQTLARMIGFPEDEANAATEDRAKPEPIEVHERARRAIMELICGFRNLRAKLLPHDAAGELQPAPKSPGQDRRRILASPTPQKAAKTQEFPTMSLGDLDGASVASALTRRSAGRMSWGARSASVRSRSPPPPMMDDLESLRHSYVVDPESASAISEMGD